MDVVYGVMGTYCASVSVYVDANQRRINGNKVQHCRGRRIGLHGAAVSGTGDRQSRAVGVVVVLAEVPLRRQCVFGSIDTKIHGRVANLPGAQIALRRHPRGQLREARKRIVRRRFEGRILEHWTTALLQRIWGNPHLENERLRGQGSECAMHDPKHHQHVCV